MSLESDHFSFVFFSMSNVKCPLLSVSVSVNEWANQRVFESESECANELMLNVRTANANAYTPTDFVISLLICLWLSLFSSYAPSSFFHYYALFYVRSLLHSPLFDASEKM